MEGNMKESNIFNNNILGINKEKSLVEEHTFGKIFYFKTIRKDGKKYIGEWKEGKQHGNGIIISITNEKF